MNNVEKMVRLANRFEGKINKFSQSNDVDKGGDVSASYAKLASEDILGPEKAEFDASTAKSKFFPVLNALAKKGQGSFKFGGEVAYYAVRKAGKWVVDPTKSGFKLESSGVFDVKTATNLAALVKTFNQAFVAAVQKTLNGVGDMPTSELKAYNTIDQTMGIFVKEIISW